MVEALTWSIDADSLWINQQKQATRLTEACTILTMYVTSTWAAGCLAISAPINNVKSNRMIVVMDDDDENEDSKEIDRLECFAKAIPSLIVLVDHLRGDTWLQVQGKQQLRNRLMVEQTNCQQMTSLTKKYDAIRRTADLWIKVASALDTEVIRMSRSKYIQRLEASIDKARHQNTSDHLLELILLLGRRKASFIDELLRPAHKSDSGACDIHDALLGLVSAAVISSNEEIVDLAFIIIRRIIMASTDSLATMKELIEPLMDMSNNDDAVSRSITGLLTEMSIQFPQQILGQILVD
ncbi:hypothetical protein BDF22DRAFT_148980 [Syncephalis plumigaleata]|nr:hypothetical protein BDF22DRAFT_148980 [Syncephalis plumigaleata]